MSSRITRDHKESSGCGYLVCGADTVPFGHH